MEVGQRVKEAGGDECGSLRWSGALEGTDGEWLGIEWDGGSRGKHRGIYKGEQVFECRWEDSSCSFVRPAKVRSGRSFETAVRVKYSSEEQGDAEQAYVLTETDQKVGIEFVGERKAQAVMADYARLPTISLCGEEVSFSESPGCAKRMCPKVRHLDLRGNLINDWEVVEDITEGLEQLRCLDMSGNRLDELKREPQRIPTTVTSLVLHSMRLSWGETEALQRHLGGSVREISLCFNDLSLQGASQAHWSALTQISLASNCVTCWENVTNALGVLPSLERLILNDNPIEKVHYQESTFLKLQSLSLGGTEISSWTAVTELSQFPALTEVRLSGTPLLGSVSATLQRYLVVARFPKLVSLNGSHIAKSDREDAEKYLLHICHKRLHSEQSAKDSHLEAIAGDISADHPLYVALLQTYGEPQPEKDLGKANDTLASDFITLRVEKENEGFVTEKKLPASMTVASLKALLSHLLAMPAADQVLYYRASKSALGAGEELDDDERSLAYYGMATGGSLLARELDDR